MRGTIKSFFVTPQIAKLSGERSNSGNPRDLVLGGERIRWSESINRSALQQDMKAFEVVRLDDLKDYRGSWANQEISLPKDHRIALLINRVKKPDQLVKLEIDTNRKSVVSAETIDACAW